MKYQPVFRPISPTFFRNIANSIANLVDGALNRIFALKHEAATIRSMVVNISFIIFWILFIYASHTHTQFIELENTWLKVAKTGEIENIFIASVSITLSILLNRVVILHLLALVVPIWLMNHVAAIYLADIFEKEEEVAHTFVKQAAFAGYYHSIHIRQGKVAKGNEESPIIQIGGPGYVVVELDSAVVLESPDGSVRVIDSNPKESHGYSLIHGFERIRQGIDLRDVIQKQDVASRSRDGIPVTAKDIQYSYSIYRGPNPVKTPQKPYPFDENAVRSLVYGATRTVRLNEVSEHKPDWFEPLPGKIIGPISAEMNSFINQRSLSDFLIAIDKPEGESSQEQKKESSERLDVIPSPNENLADQTGLPGARTIPDPLQTANPPGKPNQTETAGASPEFVPRSMLTKMFYDSFQARAHRGIFLNWIGVGTWDTPAQAQIILKSHREAWKISRDNFARGNPTELKRLSEDARQREFPRLIEEVLLRTFYNEPQDQDIDQEIKSLLQEYLGVLERARELFRPDIPEDILEAIQEINRWLFPEHIPVGKPEA